MFSHQTRMFSQQSRMFSPGTMAYEAGTCVVDQRAGRRPRIDPFRSRGDALCGGYKDRLRLGHHRQHGFGGSIIFLQNDTM